MKTVPDFMKPCCVRFPGECQTSSRGWAGRGAADRTPPTTELSNQKKDDNAQ